MRTGRPAIRRSRLFIVKREDNAAHSGIRRYSASPTTSNNAKRIANSKKTRYHPKAREAGLNLHPHGSYCRLLTSLSKTCHLTPAPAHTPHPKGTRICQKAFNAGDNTSLHIQVRMMTDPPSASTAHHFGASPKHSLNSSSPRIHSRHGVTSSPLHRNGDRMNTCILHL